MSRLCELFILKTKKNCVRLFCKNRTIKVKEEGLEKNLKNILKYTLFTALGITMFWLVYKDANFETIWIQLKDAHFGWVLLSLIFGLFSHISRTLRWKIALEPLGEKPTVRNTFLAVMISYFMNLLLPRMGEFVRCGMLSKYEKIKFSKLFGTVVTERIIDMVMFVLLFLLVLVLEFDKVIHFTDNNPEVEATVIRVISSPYLWIGLVVAASAVVYYLKKHKNNDGKNKVEEILSGFSDGIQSVLTMERKFAYIAHTLFIWFMYYLMLQVCLYALDCTAGIGLSAGLTTFVLGAIGMITPVQGGIGAWHFFAIQSLAMYGVGRECAESFALLNHGSMNLMIIILGVICVIILPIVNRNYHPKSNEEAE